MDPIERQDTPPSPPADVAIATDPEDYGPANENLPPDEQEALRTLAIALMETDSLGRRDYVKRVKKTHQFFRGEQFIYWSERLGEWLRPTIEQHLQARQPFRFVTNIVRPFALTLMAALSPTVPKIRFWPQSPQQQDDVATADAATAIAEHIQRVNRMEKLSVDEAFHLCLDGTVAGYLRWVNDADRFGTITKPVIESVEREIEPSAFECPGCGMKLPAPGVCPMCQYPVGPEAMTPPVMASVPEQTGTEEIPNGQVVIDMFGPLNVKMPLTAREQRDFGYIAHVSEIATAKVQAVHPHVADKIGKGDSLGAMNDTTERQDRLSLASGRRGGAVAGSETGESIVTYHRIWFRPWTFRGIKDPVLREKIAARFPTGCRANFADDTYCESVEESMDDHWRVLHATPGDGQARDGLLFDLISIQERYNTLKNLQMETHQHGIPTLFMDRDVVNVKAWENSGSRPGSGVGVRGRAGMPLSNAFHETNPAQVSRQAVEEGRQLATEDAQFSTGGFAALFGGGALNTETASGYAMQRDQAMGRLSMVFRQSREFHAELMVLGVEEMKRNMKEGDPMEVALLGPEGQFDSKTIGLEDLRGKYRAYPESDENFPESFSQRKDGVMQLLEAKSPVIEGAMASPNAMRSIWRTIGIRDFELPGEHARKRQYREIQAGLRAAPVQGPPVPDPTVDPMMLVPGQMPPMVKGPPQSTVPIDYEFDNHAVHFATIQEWIESPAAEAEKLSNPAGFENVRLHGLAHKAATEQQMMEQVQQQMAMQPQPPAEQPPA